MKRIIETASSKGVKEVEVFYRELINNEIRFENNNLKNIIASQNSGMGIRGVYDGRIGFCSLTHETDVQEAIDRLIESSKFSEPKEFEFSKPSQYVKPKIYSKSIEKISIEKIVSDGEKIIDSIKQYDKNILTNITFETEVKTIKINNSFGVDEEYKKSSFVVYVSGQIIDGTNFIEVDCYKYGIDTQYDINTLIATFIERMKLSRIQTEFESGKTKILFTPKAFGDIMSTISQGVNGNAVEK